MAPRGAIFLIQPAGRSAGAPPASYHGPVGQCFPYRDCATPSPLAKRFAFTIVAALAPPAVAPVVAIPANPHAHTGPFDGHALGRHTGSRNGCRQHGSGSNDEQCCAHGFTPSLIVAYFAWANTEVSTMSDCFGSDPVFVFIGQDERSFREMNAELHHAPAFGRRACRRGLRRRDSRRLENSGFSRDAGVSDSPF